MTLKNITLKGVSAVAPAPDVPALAADHMTTYLVAPQTIMYRGGDADFRWLKMDDTYAPQIAERLRNMQLYGHMLIERLDQQTIDAKKIETSVDKVPVVIKEIDDKTAMEIALIENLQRVDLNPLEEARAFQRLIDEYGYKHDQLATVLGKSRSHISNLLRLLQLPKPVQDKLLAGNITMGHARALITSDNAEELAEQIVKNNLSVRDAEKLAAKKARQEKAVGTPQKIAKAIAGAAKQQKDADIRALETNLSELLGLRVSIEPETNAKGVLCISYDNLDQLDDVLRRLSR